MASAAIEPLIRITGVNHYFGAGALRKQILFDASAEIFPGEIVILTGPSGSGKTTLLTLSGALRSVEEGSLRIFGQELRGASRGDLVRIRERIGFIFQHHNLLESLTACENVQMALGMGAPLPAGEARKRCADMLETVGLGHRVDHYPHELSGGQKQRVAIARALVHRPQVILADEPTAALDRKSGREVVDLLHQLAKSQGCAILLVTHDHRILDIADQILTLEDGRISSFASGMAADTDRMLTAFAQLNRKGELVRHLSGLPDKEFLTMMEKMTGEFEEFLRATDLGNHEAVEALFDQVLEAVTQRIRGLLAAERATIFLVDRDRGLLESRIAHGDGSRPLSIQIPLATGIAGRVAASGEALNIADPYKHPDFNPDVDRQTGYRTRSILCMPILDRHKEVFAVAQLLNKMQGESFSARDEEMFREAAAPLGLILESSLRLARSREGQRPHGTPSGTAN